MGRWQDFTITLPSNRQIKRKQWGSIWGLSNGQLFRKKYVQHSDSEDAEKGQALSWLVEGWLALNILMPFVKICSILDPAFPYSCEQKDAECCSKPWNHTWSYTGREWHQLMIPQWWSGAQKYTHVSKARVLQTLKDPRSCWAKGPCSRDQGIPVGGLFPIHPRLNLHYIWSTHLKSSYIIKG